MITIDKTQDSNIEKTKLNAEDIIKQFSDLVIGDAEYSRREAELKAEQQQDKIQELIRNTKKGLDCPEWFTLDKFKGQIPEIKPGTNYIISGQPNRGKTHLACSIALELARRGAGASVLAYEPDVYISCKGQLGEIVNQITHRYKQADILVWDDLGQSMERPEQWMLNIIKSIFDYRAKRHKPNIVTCQYEFSRITEIMGANLLRRIVQKQAGEIRHIEVKL